MSMFLECVDDRYVGEVRDLDGQIILSVTEPITASEMSARLTAAGEHVLDIQEAFSSAYRMKLAGTAGQHRAFHNLYWRAHDGSATEEDAQWVADELASHNSIHRTISLLHTLAMMHATQHEDVVASYLDHENDGQQADFAMRTLLAFGLIDKYADLLVHWMRDISPTERHRLRGWAIAIAGGALAKHQNKKVLHALIRSASDRAVTLGERGTALMSLGRMLGIPVAEQAQHDGDTQFAQRLIDEAEAIYRKLR